MSQKAKRLLAAGIATISIAAAPVTSLAIGSGSAGVPLACSGTGNGGCAG